MSINRILLAALLMATLAACSQSNHYATATPSTPQPEPSPQAATSVPAVANSTTSPAGSAIAGSAAIATTSSPADSTINPCTGADTGLTTDRKQAYATLVQHAMEDKAKPTDIAIMRFMAVNGWATVYASTGISDDGWFVFDETGGNPRFKDVWGGMATADDRAGLIKWADALGAPSDFAQCFAETVIQ